MSTLRLVERFASGDRRAVVPDVLRFLELFWAVAHGLERTSKRMTRDLGVTGPQRLVLRVVGLFPGLSAGELARILHVHSSTLTGVLRRLETQRLLKRVQDPADRRRAVLRLTSKGRRANASRVGTVEAAVAAGLAGISAQDRAVAWRVLERVASRLEQGLDDNRRLNAARRAARRVRANPRSYRP